MAGDLRFALRQFPSRSRVRRHGHSDHCDRHRSSAQAIFSIVNGVLLRPLDLPHPERVVVVDETSPPKLSLIPTTPGRLSPDWRQQSSAFESLAALYPRSYNSTAMGSAVSIAARCVSPDYFSVLGVKPILGRAFLPEEETAGKDRVVILSYQSWLSQFGGRASIIGETVRLDDRPFVVIGVLPKLMTFDWKPFIFTPKAFAPSDRADHSSHFLTVIGRLRPDASVKQAQSELEVISNRIARQHPDSNQGIGVRVAAMLDAGNSDVRLQLWVLLGAGRPPPGDRVRQCRERAFVCWPAPARDKRRYQSESPLAPPAIASFGSFLAKSLLIDPMTGAVLGILLAAASMAAIGAFCLSFCRTRGSNRRGRLCPVPDGCPDDSRGIRNRPSCPPCRHTWEHVQIAQRLGTGLIGQPGTAANSRCLGRRGSRTGVDPARRHGAARPDSDGDAAD